MRFISSLCVFLLGCGGASVAFPDAAGDDSGGGPDGTVDSGVDSGDIDTGTDTMPCPLKCSPTTYEVLDCNDMVVQTCAPTEACDIGQAKCVNACVAQSNNRQSIGCDFYPAYLEVLNSVALKCHAIVVANTWKAPAKIQADYNGQQLTVATFARVPAGSGPSITYGAYDPMTGIKPGEVAILFLGGNNGAQGCPAPPATTGTMAQIVGTTIGKAFHVTTDVPVAVYQVQPYGGGAAAVTGSSLLLPSTAWGVNYVVNTASPMTVAPPSFDIVASQNGTQIKLLPKVAVTAGGGIPSGMAGQQMTFMLNAGEVAQIAQAADLVGSIIESSKPVGLWSASACMNVPMNTTFCDHGEQMLLPIQALGSEYAAVSHRPRTMEPWLWRIVGVVDGTNLTFSPAVNGAPPTIAKGAIAEFESTAPFVVSSQDAAHPFQLLAYMSGSSWPKLGNTPGYGDPDHVVITPPGQFLRSYVFFTDPTFPETNLVVVRAKNGNTFEDVSLDCAGKLANWMPLGTNYEYTRQDLQTGNFAPVGNCSNGRHEITSKGPFGITVWGWGTPTTSTFTGYVSYGYPGGTNVRAINNVTVPAQ